MHDSSIGYDCNVNTNRLLIKLMAKKRDRFSQAVHDIIENLESLQMLLDRCVDDEGMIDVESRFHNELCDLIDETRIASSWEELEEVINRGKTVEIDVDSFLSRHGRTTISMSWPSQDQENPLT